MSEYLEKRKREEQREEELKLQKKQLFAQRVSAAAAVANAVVAAQTAAEVEKMRHEASAAAECGMVEQAFLPPSARPSDERWHSALNPKIEPEAELAKQRQKRIRDILLNRLVPNYETQQYDLADLDEKFIDLDLERTDASSDEPMSDKEVNEMVTSLTQQVASLTEQIQTLKTSGISDALLPLCKDIAADKLEYLRSTISTNSPAFPSCLKKVYEKYEEQLKYLQSKNEEQLRLLKADIQKSSVER